MGQVGTGIKYPRRGNIVCLCGCKSNQIQQASLWAIEETRRYPVCKWPSQVAGRECHSERSTASSPRHLSTFWPLPRGFDAPGLRICELW
jgi:hypothetical protein